MPLTEADSTVAISLSPCELEMREALEEIRAKVDELAEHRPIQRYLTVADAATYSGLGDDSIRRFVDRGELNAYRPNGRVLIDRLELDTLIRASTSRRRKGRGRRHNNSLELSA